MKLTTGQVEKVAKLASLKVDSSSADKYSAQLSKILDYIDQLNKVDTKEAKSLFNVSGKDGVEREDRTSDSLTQEETLSNSLSKDKGFFVTKGVFRDE